MKRTTHTPVVTWFTTLALLVSMCASLSFSQRTTAQSNEPSQASQRDARSQATADYPALAKYATDLTQLALQGKLEPANGHDADIARVITSLSRATTKAPVVVGAFDLDRNAIARGLAFRIVFGEVPESLRDKRVFSLSIYALAKGAKTSEEFESRVQSVFAEAAKADGQIILFVDQLHQYAGVRATTVASAAVQAAIEANHLRMVGGATPEAYSQYIASEANVAKLFEVIPIDRTTETASDPTSVKNNRKSPINEEFEGDKISSDMRELMKSVGPNGRVKAIIQVNDVHNSEISSLLKRRGVLISDSMAQIGAIKVDLPAKAIEELAKRNSVNHISPDVKLESFGHVTATTGTDLIRTQQNNTGVLGTGLAASTTTFDGTGIGIAVLDSGLDTGHRAFTKNGVGGAGRIVFSKDFTGENIVLDNYGHGSHVTSSAAGMSNSGNYDGVARGASIINLRVLNSQGTGSTSALLSALNWILSPADPALPVSSSNPLNKNKYNIRIVNMSLGAPAIDSYKNDPVCRASRALVDAGIVVVAAAGNNGKDAIGNKLYGQIHSPGDEPSVITVGAVNTLGTNARNDDGIATYSSRGPSRGHWTDANGVKHYDNLLKPDLSAPGNKLIYAEADGNLLVTQHPELDAGVSPAENKKMMYLSGTSMATPVVAGTAAILLQANPKLTPNMIKMILMYTAQPLAGYNMLEQGSGELNV